MIVLCKVPLSVTEIGIIMRNQLSEEAIMKNEKFREKTTTTIPITAY